MEFYTLDIKSATTLLPAQKTAPRGPVLLYNLSSFLDNLEDMEEGDYIMITTV
jgi:hypothetical protein